MSTVIARIVRAVGFVIGGTLIAGALLYVLEANTGNWLVGAVMDVATWFATPFRGIFDLDENKAQVVINWGIGAAIYFVVALLLAALVERVATRLHDREGQDTTQAA